MWCYVLIIDDNLVNFHKVDLILDPKISQLSPGNFVKFNYICKEYNILPTNNFIQNLSFLLDVYKKKKDILVINLIFYLAEEYFRYLRDNKLLNNDKIFEIKNYILQNLNNFLLYNINQNSLIKAVNDKLHYE